MAFTLDDDEVEARGSEDRLVGMPVKAAPLQISLFALKPLFGLSISPDEDGDDDVDAAEAEAAAGRMSSPLRVGSEGRSGRPSRNFEDDEEVAGAELEVAETPSPPPLPLATGSGALLDDDDDVAAVDGGYCSGSRRCS